MVTIHFRGITRRSGIYYPSVLGGSRVVLAPTLPKHLGRNLWVPATSNKSEGRRTSIMTMGSTGTLLSSASCQWIWPFIPYPQRTSPPTNYSSCESHNVLQRPGFPVTVFLRPCNAWYNRLTDGVRLPLHTFPADLVGRARDYIRFFLGSLILFGTGVLGINQKFNGGKEGER